jgi:hypothetical protein
MRIVVAHASDAVTFTNPHARDTGIDYDSDSDEDFWAQEGADSLKDEDEVSEDEGSDCSSYIVPDGVYSEDEVSDAGDLVAVRKAEATVGERIALGPQGGPQTSTTLPPGFAGAPRCEVVPDMGLCSLRFTSASGTAAEALDMKDWIESAFETKKKEGAAAAREAAIAAFWEQHEAELAAHVHGSKDGIEKLREAFEKLLPDAKDKRVAHRIKQLALKTDGRWAVSAEKLQKLGMEDKLSGVVPINTFFQQEKREPGKESPGDDGQGQAAGQDGLPVQQAERGAPASAGAAESAAADESGAKKKRRRVTPQLVDSSGKTADAPSAKASDPPAAKSSEHNENSMSTTGGSPTKAAPRKSVASGAKSKTPAETRKSKSLFSYSGVAVPKQQDAASAPVTKGKVHPFIDGDGTPQ